MQAHRFEKWPQGFDYDQLTYLFKGKEAASSKREYRHTCTGADLGNLKGGALRARL